MGINRGVFVDETIVVLVAAGIGGANPCPASAVRKGIEAEVEVGRGRCAMRTKGLLRRGRREE